MKWVNVFDKISHNGSLNCPNCDFRYLEQTFYLIETQECKSCKTDLIIFSLPGQHRYIYTIDLKNSPTVFNTIVEYLSKESNENGYKNLRELILLFSEKHFDEKSSTYIYTSPPWPSNNGDKDMLIE